MLKGFDPKPGRQYTSEEPTYITPDVYVHKVGDKYFVVANDDGLPKLKISDFYRTALAGGPKAREYIQEKLRSAQWLIRSIQQRQRTIVKVTESILKFQREFFDKGTAHLKPLILRDVAEDIGMHESTVSRVTTNKYVHTPQGIYELKYFFNSGIARTDGDDLASEAVKLKIKQIIGRRARKSPHSDQQHRRAAQGPEHRDRAAHGRQVPRAAPHPLLVETSPGFLIAGARQRIRRPLRLLSLDGKRGNSCARYGPVRVIAAHTVNRPTGRKRHAALDDVSAHGWLASGAGVCGREAGEDPQVLQQGSDLRARGVLGRAWFPPRRRSEHHAAQRHRHQRQGDDRGHVLLDRPGGGAHRAPGAKWKDKIRDHKPHGGPSTSVRELVIPAEEIEPRPQAEADGSRGRGRRRPPRRFNVIKDERFTARSMTVEDAVMQLNLLGDELLVFTDARHRRHLGAPPPQGRQLRSHRDRGRRRREPERALIRRRAP